MEMLAELDPEVFFWEPINPRGGNLKRMEAVGIDWARGLSGSAWAHEFTVQWGLIDRFASRCEIQF